MDEAGRPAAGDREAGEAGGGGHPRGDRARVRRDHGGPRRPRRRAAAGARAARAEAGDPDRQGERQAGDRRDPDAGVDDHQLAPDPRRGVRRRERRARRRRRGDALRRDQRRHATRSRRSRTMAQIIEAVEAGPVDVPRAAARAAYRSAVCCPTRRRDIGERLSARALVAFTPVRRHGAPPRPAAHPAAAARLHPDARGAQPARDVAGASRRSSSTTSPRPTPWSARSTTRCCPSSGSSAGDLVVIVAGSPPGHRRLDQPDPGAPARRGRPGLTVRADLTRARPRRA